MDSFKLRPKEVSDDLRILPMPRSVRTSDRILTEGKEQGMATATLTSKGQITLPKTIRDRLRVDTGDQVDFVVNERGDVVVLAVSLDIAELKGLLKRQRRHGG